MPTSLREDVARVDLRLRFAIEDAIRKEIYRVFGAMHCGGDNVLAHAAIAAVEEAGFAIVPREP